MPYIKVGQENTADINLHDTDRGAFGRPEAWIIELRPVRSPSTRRSARPSAPVGPDAVTHRGECGRACGHRARFGCRTGPICSAA